jgi:hypothetical protein
VSLVLPGGEAEPIAEALAEQALRFGVMLADHGVPPATSSPSIGAGIDPAAWLGQDKDPSAAVPEHARELVSVRLCDDPKFDADAFQLALLACAYRGPIVIDLRECADPWGRLRDLT